ncbi:polyunsaturated fatty acid 5-lipoxygenase-like [Chiloscyllium punctatum]|uniref:polyunsaturated fatty acid 5-lipoxygenase-like n=1 Tax=Chiloscyllium punctatum TaxID=137246 RepID=UPI003B63F89E
MITYKVMIETGTDLCAGTKSYVFCTLIGEREKSHKASVNRWLHNDLKRGTVDHYEIASDWNLGSINFVELEVTLFNFQDYWFCCCVTVEIPEGNTFHFPCYKWLANHTVRLREGTAKRIYDDGPLFQCYRKNELWEKQQLYRWRELPSKMPKCIDALSVDDLPVDLRFGCEKELGFEFSAIESFSELSLKEKVNKLECSWTTVEDFNHIFWEVELVIAVFAKHHWKEDWFFGNQFLNGFNPVLIEKCNKIPPNFPVTDDMVRTSLRNSTLKQEIENENIYIANYEILDGIPANVIEGVQQYTAAPICLLYRNEQNYMIPIAIQLKQTLGEDNPIFLPSDAELDWMLAKMWVRSCDFQHFELVSHLLKTHLIAETFSMATLRQLPSVHPIYKLLTPHVKYTIHINTVARIKLIGNNGYISQMFGVKEDDFHFLCSKAFQRLTYRSLCLPDNLKDRGVTELKGYCYMDDGLLLWRAIHEFVTGIVMYYYKEDSEIQDDSELQAWIKDLTEVGLEGIGDSEFPVAFHTREDLCKFLTMIIFTCSAQHAALNNAQYDWGAWVPNSPCSMRKPPPTTKGIVTMEHIMESLPSLHQSCLQMAILCILNQKPWEMRKLGDYNEKYFTEEKVKTIIGRFQDKLKEIAYLICDERDEKLLPRYDYLCPKNIENSITI